MALALLSHIVLLPTRSAVSRWELEKVFTLGLCLAVSLAQQQSPGTEIPVDLAVYLEDVDNPASGRAVQPGKPVIIKLGSSFDMSCHMKPGRDKNAFVEWYKDGQVFSETSKAILTKWLGSTLYQDYQIRFLNFSLEDAGAYTCVTDQGMVHANLTVAPVIKNFKPQVVGYEGEPAVLQCVAEGFPQPTVEWMDKNNAVLQTPTSNELKFPKISQLHNGTYKCIANNSAGQINKTVALFVVVRTNFKNAMPSVVSVPVGDSVILKCDADGRPAPSYKWFVQTRETQRRQLIKAGPTYSLPNVQEQSNVTCEVHSYFPWSHQPAQEPLVHTFQIKLGGNPRGKPSSSGISLIALPSLIFVAALLQFIVTV